MSDMIVWLKMGEISRNSEFSTNWKKWQQSLAYISKKEEGKKTGVTREYTMPFQTKLGKAGVMPLVINIHLALLLIHYGSSFHLGNEDNSSASDSQNRQTS